MNNKEQLADAISVAAEAHMEQTDRGGLPYILHPLHLMSQLMFDIELATIAVLHDVVEDSSYDMGYFSRKGYTYRVMVALDLLTHKEGDTYEEYIERVSSNYDAVRVKRKDLEHNSDITRLKGVSDSDFKRMEKYHKAFTFLGRAKARFMAARECV